MYTPKGTRTSGSIQLLTLLSFIVGLIAGCGPKEEAPPPAEISIFANGFTSEVGDQATIGIVLETRPSADVVITLAASDATEASVAPASLTFTAENFDVEQTVAVTGVDDDVADGNQDYDVTATIASDDTRYAELVVDPLALTNVDDDEAGIRVGPVSSATSELGDPATFDIVLQSQPTANVVISFDTDDPSEGLTDVLSLTFTESNWDAPQTVTVTGQNDDVADGVGAYNVVFDAPSSSDAAYAALSIDPVALVNIDDETAGIIVTAMSGPTAENAGTATFTVRLTSEPLDDVGVSLDSSNGNEGTVDQTLLTFTSLDWDQPQTVTLTGQDDDIDDDDQAYQVVFGATTSNDPDYDAITPDPIPVTNVDDDQAGITVSQAAGAATEGGGQATFTVTLNSEPVNPVTLSFDTDDAGEGMPDVTSLMFDASGWFMPKTVTVTGQDDALNDGFQVFSIVFSATTSGDPKYNGMAVPSVSVVNVDDEITGIIVSEASGNTSEDMDTATFTVVLSKQPSDDVTLTFDTNNAAEGIPDVTSLTFTNMDWDIAQTVTVTGQDDAVMDGAQSYAIDFNPATSTDAFFNGLQPNSVALVNDDNDGAQNIGYYDMSLGMGSANQEPGITAAGFTAVLMNDLTATDLMGIDVLVVQNPSNSAYGSEYLNRLTDIENAVSGGMVLVIHDRYVTGAATILPGGGSVSAVRSFTNDDDINIGDNTTLVTNGAGGMLDDTSLDGGNSSSHGYVTEASIPAGGLSILTRPTATESVTFSYPHGSGHVIYSTIPLDYYLAGNGGATIQANMTDIYYPNVVDYAGSGL